ncbi:MAG: aminoacyl-tRNA hydrolase [Flavobacteriales bacterium]|nr:aminoacyl-tRNA hydrolase [Flavobacteriales bacterium]
MIPDLYTEFQFKTSRSGGKGGQHVNKTESKVELIFHVNNSELLTEDQKTILLERWTNKMDSEGYFHLTEEGDRSQIKNKEELIRKFYALLKSALRPVKKRKTTKVPKAVKAKRREDKNRRSDIKANRQKPKL